jgi:GH15 family glucan-1,4-alpha-glucosidase
VQELVRHVIGIRGQSEFRLTLEPRFNYGRDRHSVHRTANGAVFETTSTALGFASPVPLHLTGGDVNIDFSLSAGDSRTFVLRSGSDAEVMSEHEAEQRRRATVTMWRAWLSASTYSGRWRERVHRSALSLALLTYAPTGAIVAAATTSLPEQIGGARNWDYRYVWARDMGFSQYALSRLGFTREALFVNRFARALAAEQAAPGEVAPLQPLYRVDGDTRITEETLDHFEGYAGSGPVRIGNAAAGQLQLDIYGELIDSIYLYEQLALAGRGQLMPYRSDPQHFTHSRLMCWVALDRAIRIAINRALPADLARWTAERDAIFAWIMTKGWSEQRHAFVQHDGTDVLDASLLMMPLVHFIAPTDPRWISTLDAIGEELVRDSLVYRYNPSATPDGLEGDEGTFSMCTFWYVECLARAGRLEEAQLILEKTFTYANHLGLYSEQVGPRGELLGNFPQAFTHLALISAAIDLDRHLAMAPAA